MQSGGERCGVEERQAPQRCRSAGVAVIAATSVRAAVTAAPQAGKVAPEREIGLGFLANVIFDLSRPIPTIDSRRPSGSDGSH